MIFGTLNLEDLAHLYNYLFRNYIKSITNTLYTSL